MGTIALILAFFLLLTSTNANLRDNFWELGVLKAIGLSKSQTQSMLLYEAFSTVLAALILGIGIGVLIAYTLTAQFYLFIELPIRLSVSQSVSFFIRDVVPHNAIRGHDRDVISDHTSGSVDTCSVRP